MNAPQNFSCLKLFSLVSSLYKTAINTSMYEYSWYSSSEEPVITYLSFLYRNDWDV
jgi:hypothetical protein